MKKHSYFSFSLLFILFFLGLSFISPGGLFVLDFVITPFVSFQAWQATTLQWHFVDILNYTFGYALTTKIYYLLVFSLGLFASAKIGKAIKLLSKSSLSLPLLQSCSAVFLLCNPWVYERLITQPGIAAGMFMMVLGIHYLIENVLSIRKYSLIWAGVSFGGAFMLFPHASLMILLISILYLLIFCKHIPVKYYILFPFLILIPNINWLIGDIFYKTQDLGTTALQNFDWENIEGFAGNSLSGLGTELTHLFLNGFWGERFHILTPEKFNEYWFVFACIAFVFIIWGNIKLFQLHRKIWFFFTFIGVISYILALGISSDIFGYFNTWIYQNIPAYIGMREPQKWLGITMISYCIFFVLGIISFKEKVKFISVPLMFLLVFVLLNCWNPMNIFGYQGQLYGSTIPKGYSELIIRERVKSASPKYLVFPWHTYMSCYWTRGKNIASMQDKLFYPLQTVVADNLEINTKYSNSTSKTSKNIETYLKNKDITLLKQEDIAYIIYQKNCADISNYTFLGDSKNLTLEYENSTVALYKIK